MQISQRLSTEGASQSIHYLNTAPLRLVYCDADTVWSVGLTEFDDTGGAYCLRYGIDASGQLARSDTILTLQLENGERFLEYATAYEAGTLSVGAVIVSPGSVDSMYTVHLARATGNEIVAFSACVLDTCSECSSANTISMSRGPSGGDILGYRKASSADSELRFWFFDAAGRRSDNIFIQNVSDYPGINEMTLRVRDATAYCLFTTTGTGDPVDSWGAYLMAFSTDRLLTVAPLQLRPVTISLATYPNPCNAEAEITYALPRISHVRLRAFDVLGREVATLEDGIVAAGNHHALFDGRDRASGIYFVKLDAGEFSQTKKLMLLK